MLLLFCFFCIVLHALETVWDSFCRRCFPSSSLPLRLSVTLHPLLLPSCLSALSTFALLSCTWLMTVWYLSRVPSVPWYALLCHCCCPVSLSLFLLLLLHPGSQPTLTYVSASNVLIHNRTMLITMLNSSPTLLVTPPWSTTSFAPNLRLSPSHFIVPPPPAGLPGTDLLYAGRDRGLTRQPPGETSRVSVHLTALALCFCTIRRDTRS